MYLTNQSVHHLKTEWRARFAEIAIQQLTITQASDWQALLDEANHYALFAAHSGIIADYEKKTLDNHAKQALLDYLARPNPACSILIRAPNLTIKQLSALIPLANITVVEHSTPNRAALQVWLQQQLLQIPLVFTPEIIELILQHTTGNQLACAQLLEKLQLIYTPGATIRIADVQAQLINQADYQLSELSDAYLLGDTPKAISVLRQAALNRTEVMLVLWVITHDLRRLLQLQQHQRRGNRFEEACKQLNIWSQKAKLYHAALKRLSITQVGDLLRITQQLDEGIKSGQNTRPWQSLERVLLAILAFGQPVI